MRAVTTDASILYFPPGCQDPDTTPLAAVTRPGSTVGVCAPALLTRTSRIPPVGVRSSIRRGASGDISDTRKDLGTTDELVSGEDLGDRDQRKR